MDFEGLPQIGKEKYAEVIIEYLEWFLICDSCFDTILVANQSDDEGTCNIIENGHLSCRQMPIFTRVLFDLFTF